MTTLLDRYGKEIKKPDPIGDGLNNILSNYWEKRVLDNLSKQPSVFSYLPWHWSLELPESCKKLLESKPVKVEWKRNKQEAP